MNMNVADINPLVEQGTVKATRHPSAPLTIYNYSAVCQYERRWCDVSMACRGLILHDNGTVVARPFPKFFNLEEHKQVSEGRALPWEDKPFAIAEKLDGSLGILYATDEGLAIATRGSFTSEQAQWATRLLWSKYGHFIPDPSLTYLFEIIYPANRIVVDYGGMADLVLLTVIDTATGRDVDGEHGWSGPMARTFDASCPPADVIGSLDLTDDGNTEGVVLRFDWPEDGPQMRVKLKLDEYKRLHRLICGTSTKTVWEALFLGDDLAALMDRVPDEFHAWLKETAEKFESEFAVIDAEAHRMFDGYVTTAGREDRKAFAQLATQSRDYAPMMFKLYDGHPIRDIIWKRLKPEYARPFKAQSEDTA